MEDQAFDTWFDHACMVSWPDDLRVPRKVLASSMPPAPGLLECKVDPVLGGFLVEDSELSKFLGREVEGYARLRG